MSEEKKAPEKKEAAPKKGGKLALVLVRGMINLPEEKVRTLGLLRLRRKHACVVVNDTPSMRGMAHKVGDYVTWGEVDSDTEKLLKDKRGEKDPQNPKEIKPFFRLSPPTGGFERKGIKKAFKLGGALGYRGAKINDLIKKMI